MVPNNITFNNFTCSGIYNRWPYRITGSTGDITNYGVSYILWTKIWIFFFSRRILGYNCIFKTCGFKSFIPIFDSLFKIRPPALGGCGIQIINNGLYRFHQLAIFIGFYIFRNQSPFSDNLVIIRF